MTALLTSVNFAAYLQRMEGASLKSEVAALVGESERVLDYGCGGGALCESFPPERYLGFDLSPEMVAEASRKHPAHKFTASEPTGGFEVVVASSLLHEVYSYGGFTLAPVEELFKKFYRLLPPGGAVVVRDGLLPRASEREVSLKLLHAADAARFLKFLREGPQEFTARVEEGRLRGTLAEVVHFLNVYTWGWESAERERCERVNFLTLEEWLELGRGAGFTVAVAQAVTQEDYFQHLEELVELEGERWETKVFLRFEKPAEAA